MADGDGGFACSTVSFMNTRRQHSLLTISLSPPLKRLTLLNKVDEEVMIGEKSYFLGTNQYPGTVFPTGYKLLKNFTFDYFPSVTYDLDGNLFTKKILMPKRSSSVFINYQNHSRMTMTLRLLPLLSFRWKDSLKKAGGGFLTDELPDGVRIIADTTLPRLYLKLSRIYATSPESHWYYNFIYPHDHELFEEDREDLYNIGYWETDLEPGREVTLAASTRDLAEFSYNEIEARYIESIDRIRTASGLPKKYVHLADIASNHIVQNKEIRTAAIMEGYPYGGINVRETLLSLDGCSYVTDKESYEQDFLHDLASNEANGFLPSSMNEETLQVNYGDPQVPLYFAFALARYASKERSLDFVRRYLPILENAIETIMDNYGGRTAAGDSPLLDVAKHDQSLHSETPSADGSSRVTENACVNALWHSLLRLVGESKSAIGASSGYSETAAEIESAYFETFFNYDGSYRESRDKIEVSSEMVMPLIVPSSPLNEGQRTLVCKSLVSKFLDSLDSHSIHDSLHHECNLVAMYLTEACNEVKDCEGEFGHLKWYIVKLFGLQEFTNCVSGLPKCGMSVIERYPRNLSSSVMAGEAIRLIKKLKLK